MNVLKIAWRSIQHRGFGSLLTILSMALGVMMVVAVLSIHGVVSQSFKNNNSFGYNVLVGARGGGMQLTLSTVYYLSAPVENIPYEYYLAFCDAETREKELKNSIAYQARLLEQSSADTFDAFAPSGMGAALGGQILDYCVEFQQKESMSLDKPGLYQRYTHMAVPLCMGDYYVDPETGAGYRCIGTKPSFFSELVLDIESEEKFAFAEGRCFREWDQERGFFECVIGSVVAERTGLEIGSKINLTHGDPTSANSHVHEETDFHIVGVLEQTGTPHDRVLFVNMEGFFLIEGHDKPVEDERILKTGDDSEDETGQSSDPANVDPFADEEMEDETDSQQPSESSEQEGIETEYPQLNTLTPLPIEQREVTSILVRTSLNDQYGMLAMFLPAQINEGDLETTLDWSPYRPVRAQKAAQAVNPIQQVTALFQLFVDPVRWLLLALTSLICVVSAISILVGIYNSMSQRQHEIAVMRALGAGRSKVMTIILCESIMLALAGGLIGWIGGHALNAALSPVVEARTGVSMGFFDFAPGIPLGYFSGEMNLPEWVIKMSISPEILLIPGLVVLAIMVGIYPAISAYKTDVSKSLGK